MANISVRDQDQNISIDDSTHPFYNDAIDHIDGIHEHRNIIVHQNIRSIRSNLNNFISNLQVLDRKPLIILLSEIFICDDELNFYKLNNYQLFANCNEFNRNAGIATYIHDSLQNPIVKYLDFTSADGIRVDFHLNNEFVSLIGFYRLHEFNSTLFINELNNYLPTVKSKNVIVMGDININILKEDSVAQDYLVLMSSYGLKSLVNEPTRELACLDHIFARSKLNSTLLFNAIVLNFDVTDHAATILEINRGAKTIKEDTFLRTRLDYGKLHYM